MIAGGGPEDREEVTPTPASRRGPGRPSRGVRVETKVPAELLALIEGLIGELGKDRSEVIAKLATIGYVAYSHAAPLTAVSETIRSVTP